MIEPFRYGDIETVAAMSQIYFPQSRNVSISYLKETLSRLYFDQNRQHDPDIHSLVSRDQKGKINGFLGVTKKPFLFKGAAITGAHCNHWMVTEEGRSSLVPVRLLQHFLSGPQDFSFSDGSSESSRLLWNRLGGGPSVSNSIYYKIPLRPVSFAGRLVNKPLPSLAASAVRGMAAGLDGVAGAMHIPYFYRKQPEITLLPLETETLLKYLESIRKNYPLFPEYSAAKVDRLFYFLERESRYGKLQKFGVEDKRKGWVGWFIYYSKKGDVCDVIQAVARPGRENDLFEALTWHAYQKGGVELSGRMMANQLKSFFSSKAFCLPGRMWTLTHCRDDSINLALQTQHAFLTRLEGDLWLI